MDTLPVTVLLALSAVFYLAIPGVGAFFVRSRWRVFRNAVINASLSPKITYRQLRSRAGEGGDIGDFRFLGVLEAIQDDDIIWLKNDEMVLSADMQGERVYLLPSPSTMDSDSREEMNESVPQNEAPAVLAWEKMGSLPEGVQILVSGPLHAEKGRVIFRSGQSGNLLAVFYEGGTDSILRRAVWNGRQRNEYWNLLTPGSLAGGMLTGMIFAYFFLQDPLFRIPAILSVGVSLAPLLPLFPPGILFFILYRRFWGEARLLRAERDLVRLPLRYFRKGNIGEDVVLPNGETYGCRTFREMPKDFAGEGGRIRSTSMAGKNGKGFFHWFGVITKDGEYPVRSSDPLVESIITPDHPDKLARACESRARRLEILSIFLFGTGFLVNLLIALRGLARIIR